MHTLEYFQLLCRYNRWMNDKLYEVCATIPDEVRKEDRGAFFRSMHGTLNHLLLADRAWLGRLTGVPFVARSLDQELCSDFVELRRERDKTDTALQAMVDSLSEERLASNLTYTNFQGIEVTIPVSIIMAHMFNHQTHHRGQLTTLLEQAGYDSGVTDLLVMALESR
jgi:uncharacterized damage-inducible protein DinB